MRRETNTEQMGKELHGTVRTEGMFIHLVSLLPRAFYPPVCTTIEGGEHAGKYFLR